LQGPKKCDKMVELTIFCRFLNTKVLSRALQPNVGDDGIPVVAECGEEGARVGDDHRVSLAL
jgi:hypothetical protein